MARGDHLKGHRPENAGRKPGTQNKITRDVRKAIAEFAQLTVEDFTDWLREIEDPARRCEIWLKTIQYHIPKLAQIEGNVTIKRDLKDFSDDELIALLAGQSATAQTGEDSPEPLKH